MKPRVGDEIAVGKDRLLVLSVVDADEELDEAGGRAPEVEAHIGAAMGDQWRDLYWKALVKNRRTGKTFYMNAIQCGAVGGEIMSSHIEV